MGLIRERRVFQFDRSTNPRMATAMAGNIANSARGPERKPLLALQQLIRLNERLVNRLLDKMRLPQ